MARLCGVRFKQAGKVFYFEAGDFEVEAGTYVVAETVQGLALGRVVIAPGQVIENEVRDELKPILRLATQDDVERADALKEEAAVAADLLRQKVAEQGLSMSIAGAEYDLEGKQLTAYFTAPEVGSFLSTPAGEARVASIDFNREIVKLWLTESRSMMEMAVVDLQLQHGVTVRPMEIVRQIEGPLRQITEDTRSRGRIPSRAGRDNPPAPEAQRREPAVPPQAATPPAAQSAETGAPAGRKRRRRRRRGKSGEGPGSIPPPSSD